MKPVKDLNNKRVCDLSDDKKTVYIRRGDCVTTVTADENGILNVTSEKAPLT